MSVVSDSIIYQKEAHIAWVTLNRPERLNAITPAMLDAIDAAMTDAEKDEAICVIVLTAKGRAFSAGADLKEVSDPHPLAFRRQLLAVVARFEASPLPVVAAVNGVAVAGGLELVLGCDIVIASQSARMGDGHATYGMVPGGGASIRLAKKVGVNRAKEMLFTGDLLTAEELHAIGFVNKVAPDDCLINEVEAWVGKIVDKSPLGLARMKQLVNQSAEQSLEAALEAEFSVAALHDYSHDRGEGVAAFREKRKPQFKGK